MTLVKNKSSVFHGMFSTLFKVALKHVTEAPRSVSIVLERILWPALHLGLEFFFLG